MAVKGFIIFAVARSDKNAACLNWIVQYLIMFKIACEVFDYQWKDEVLLLFFFTSCIVECSLHGKFFYIPVDNRFAMESNKGN